MNINQPGFLHSLHLAFDDFNLLGFPVFKDVFLAAHRAAAMSNVARIMNLQWHCQKTFNTKGSPWETAPQISRGSKSRKKRESFLGLTLPLVVSHVIQDLPCSVFGKTQAQMDTVLTKITFLHRCETSHASRHLHHHLDLKATGMMQIHQGLPDGEVDSDTCRSLQIIEVRWTLYLKTQRYSDLTYCIPSKMKIGWLKSPHQVVNPGFFMKRVNHSESCDIYQVLCGVFFLFVDAKKLKRLSDSTVWDCLPTSLVKHFFRQAPIRIWMLRLATVLEDLDIGQCCWVFVTTIVTTPRTWPNQISLQTFLCYGAWSFNKISHLKKDSNSFLNHTEWNLIIHMLLGAEKIAYGETCARPWGSTSFDQPQHSAVVDCYFSWPSPPHVSIGAATSEAHDTSWTQRLSSCYQGWSDSRHPRMMMEQNPQQQSSW